MFFYYFVSYRHVIQVEDPLSETTKYLKLLQKNSPDSMETHLLSFEVNMRKQKILLAFQVNSCSSVELIIGCTKPTELNSK